MFIKKILILFIFSFFNMFLNNSSLLAYELIDIKIPENFNELQKEEQKQILIKYIEKLKIIIENKIKENEKILKKKDLFIQKVNLDSLIFQKKEYNKAKELALKLEKKAQEKKFDKLFLQIKQREKIIDEYISQKQNLVLYKGSVRHAFWHSLIIDPKRAFRGRKAKGFHDYMVTVDETKKILQQLYNRNWILVDYNDLYDFSNPSRIVKKQLFLPKGKKPLIISIDDVSYYNYMKGYGFLKRILLDNTLEVVGEYIKKNGQVEYIRDGDLMMVVDDFIYKHPDFSFNGAKGIIALTGYEGVLGYRTNTGNKKLIAQAKKVADRLKTLGWKFASHSYQHVEYKTLAGFKKDMQKWINQVWPIIGDTNIFISPFGYRIPYNDARMKYLNRIGFQVYCPVSAYDWTREHNNIIIMDRIDFDGIRMTQIPKFLKPFYNIKEVYDNVNRPVKI